MTIECYYSECLYHSCNYEDEGPFCYEDECHMTEEECAEFERNRNKENKDA